MEYNGVIGRHFVRERLRKRSTWGILLIVALLSVSEAALPMSPSYLLAQVGGTETQTRAGVAENPVNSLYAELEGRAEALTVREAEIFEREVALGVEERQRNSAILLYAVFGLLLLITLNSVFDVIEVRELRTLKRMLRGRAA